MLENNNYCNLATVSHSGKPWNTPLFFVYINKSIYWWSPTNAVHSINIIDNGMAFITVYNSTIPVGKGDGACLYLDCHAQEVVEDSERNIAINAFNNKVGNKDFYIDDNNTTGDSPTRLFKANIQKAWTNIDSEKDGYYIDARKEIIVE